MISKKRILLRLPAPLHDAVKARAQSENISINCLLERYIAHGIDGARSPDMASGIMNLAKQELGASFIGLLLFGSRARGDTHDSSDTDLLLVVDDSIRIDRSLYRHWDERLPDGVSLQIAHLPTRAREAGALWLECALDARVLHDPCGKVAEFLTQARDYITSGAVVRKTTHGQGFWVPL
jgi:hypothetical protein